MLAVQTKGGGEIKKCVKTSEPLREGSPFKKLRKEPTGLKRQSETIAREKLTKPTNRTRKMLEGKKTPIQREKRKPATGKKGIGTKEIKKTKWSQNETLKTFHEINRQSRVITPHKKKRRGGVNKADKKHKRGFNTRKGKDQDRKEDQQKKTLNDAKKNHQGQKKISNSKQQRMEQNMTTEIRRRQSKNKKAIKKRTTTREEPKSN